MQHFATSVNSPLKPPPAPGAVKEQHPSGVTRKTSFSQGLNSPFGGPGQTSTRSTARHRESTDSYFGDASLTSPTGGANRHSKDESGLPTPPPPLLRRRTDTKEITQPSTQGERDKDSSLRDSGLGTSAGFAAFPRRSITLGPGATSLPPASPWGTGTSFSPMGSFGNLGQSDSSGQPATPGERKPAISTARSTSRWSKLMSRGYPEEGGPSEKLSIGNLGRLSEADTESSSRDWVEARANQPQSNETDIYGDRPRQDGSSALGGIPESSHRQNSRLGTPTAPGSREGLGFADMANASLLSGLRDVLSERTSQPPPETSAHQNVYGGGEPLSPTETNPYQSPVPEKAEPDDIGADGSNLQTLRHPGFNPLTYESMGGRLPGTSEMLSSMPASFEALTAPRGLPFGAAPDSAFSGLGGIGASSRAGLLPGWPASTGSEREQSRFASELSHSMFGGGAADLPSSSGMATLRAGLPGSGVDEGGPLSRGGGGRLGSLFPSASYAQMQSGELSRLSRQPESDESSMLYSQTSGMDASGRAALANPGSGLPSSAHPDLNSPLRAGHGLFDELLPSMLDSGRNRGSTAGFPSMDASSRAMTSAGLSDAVPTSTMGASTMPALSTTQAGPPPSQLTTTATQQPPQSQQRQMVMPDRIRWIYRDSQGATQGPFTGLEMHDWFKAGFFSAELLVRKYEDPEFEPLGQLIRRIGNSREPFLVPQIGIPHGPPSNQTGPWSGGGAGSSNQTTSPGSVQPPFAGAFPSFGTTLTAEQQNALERRKQEEQFLMARQKEYLAQQQLVQKQMHQMHAVHPQQLHHHSSAHSLHSQPSFGSMTSPSAFHPTPPQGPIQPPQAVPPFYDHMRLGGPAYLGPMGLGNEYPGAVSAAAPTQQMRDEELAALLARQNLGREAQPPPQGFGAAAFHQPPPQQQQQQDPSGHSQHVTAMLAQRAQLQREQAKHDAMLVPSSDEQQAPHDRLQEFNELRRLEEYGAGGGMMGGGSVDTMQQQQPQHQQQQRVQSSTHEDVERSHMQSFIQPGQRPVESQPEVLSLTQQVQKAASEKQSPAGLVGQAESTTAWDSTGDVGGLPHPFPPPPPQSISPLPAPAAQRNRQQLPDALTIEQEARMRSPTSSVETPSALSSVAPWAKDASDGPKGPSLKEIQEAEARKAAKAEEMAAITRRQFLEQERERLNREVNANASALQGLPSSSTWGSGSNNTPPITPTGTASAWVKPLVKPNVEGTKKTLAQIQAEEEARKQRVVNTSSSTTAGGASSAVGVGAGKRYADLASKAAAASVSVSSQGVGGSVSGSGGSGGAWTTVGATGKVKGQSGGGVPGAGARAVSGGSVGSSGVATAAASKTRPGVSTAAASAARGSSNNPTSGVSPSTPNAQEEFVKWAKGQLSKGLNSNINGVYLLSSFPFISSSHNPLYQRQELIYDECCS